MGIRPDHRKLPVSAQTQAKQSNMSDNVIHFKRQLSQINMMILNTDDVHMRTHIGLLRNDIRGDTKRPLEDILVVDPGAVVHHKQQLHKAAISL